MIVDINWVRMAKKRLAEIDATTQKVRWFSNDQEVVPVGNVIPGCSYTDLPLMTKFKMKELDDE